ncbi:hypothetical protein BU24DRAFT_442612 [Aaosphaeria arxii CBS 175.79]|uniref:Uncharacterized protein n=1 Tax=Aaosphaeria arxii CBS 175.79 TaxID=1450172 RepID=A0A6A5XK00_9PLEO|nr:uncharacterized protein BU24DRAFT_442612 [Aaosphaeria arxii CBS 175.79]KAF2013608.1 hypothetical protein BU24DRAFT_442612 [Aaosphaeria arxii CBS 175.79]
MKSVLIVGAGPAGLATAKTLLHRTGGTFRVTIFEASDRVGGMWRGRPGEEGDKCSPHMRTNLSRFCVAFSDLSWHSVASDTTDGRSKSLSMFPKAHEVGRYLEEYARKFIPDGVTICNRQVKAAKLEGDRPRRWIVSSLDTTTSTTHEDEFDYLVVASGFFDRPSQDDLHSNSKNGSHSAGIQASSKFRDVSSLAKSAGNIVVIGGGISGIEAAATAAFQISDAKYAPGKVKPVHAESKIYHVFNRPFYPLPRYLPGNPHNPDIQDYRLAPDFLPLDLAMYNLGRRGTGEIFATNGQVPAEKAKKGHEFIRLNLGGDQRDLGHPQLVYTPIQTECPAYTGVSDTYTEFVRSGLIVPVQGRASVEETDDKTSVHALQKGLWSLHSDVSQTSEETTYTIDNVTGIIKAIGFEAHLEYLSDSVRQALDYDSQCHRVPFLLSRGSIQNPNVPELAFVGFYEGPYWGVIEAQARLVGHIWDPESSVPRESLSAVTSDISQSKSIREAIKRDDLDVPQFWMMDYVGLIDEFSRLASIPRNDTTFPGQSGPAFASRYAEPGPSTEAAEEVIQEVHSLLEASSSEGRFVAAAAFRAMQGDWTLLRKIDSRHPSSPGGTLAGSASFHPREPTSPNATAEFLYIETGTFTMDNGYSFPATRRYVYRYNEATDKISTYFVQDDGESAERLFNSLVFSKPEDVEKGWIAKSTHWCDPDNYESSCEFRFRGAALSTFGITYKVNGPNKNYSHESWYGRRVPGSLEN